MKTTILALALTTSVAAGNAAAADKAAVLETYADIARATYGDALTTARALGGAVDRLIASPNDSTLEAARQAWRAARVPYMQSEAYRFGNPIVDDWEGRVNSWPLDEGLIDYVAASYGTESADNPFYVANVIASPTLTAGGKTIDATRITKTLLADDLQEAGGIEANVATGYHAIEFLLWGQDLHGTGPGAGERPATDFDPANCTGGNCDRRAAYLKAATDLLVDDLAWMVEQWGPDGAARQALTEHGADGGVAAIVTGLGSLSYGELAGERIKLGLMLHDPEEEQDCFSDNTYNSHFYDLKGIINVYTGRYQRIDGATVSGASLSDLVAAADPALNKQMLADFEASELAMKRLVDRAETVEAYDQMIGPDNPEGNAAVQAVIDALTAQTGTIERIASVLGLEQIAFEGSDSLDNPAAVFQ